MTARKFFSNPFRLAGVCIAAFFLLHLLLLVGRVYGPPYIVRFCGLIQGMSTTPFFMETGFVAFGFLCLLAMNHYRRKWDGDEFVTLEVPDEIPTTASTDAPTDAPTDASTAEPSTKPTAESTSTPPDA